MNEIVSGPAFLLDWQAAESAAVDHMKTLGFIDAQATGPGTDGGIDAQSSDAAAQVKFYANPVGRPDIQRLRGAAHEYRLSLFYSTGGYTKEAVAYANGAGVALFLMDPYGHCGPTSDLALLLAEPEHVQERKQRMEDLQATQYRFAASAVESDLNLYMQFARKISMDPKEEALYSHVASGLEVNVRDFRTATESKQFEDADIAFGEIQKRNAFLSWMTDPALKKDFANLEEAISEGWQRDATPGSDFLLQRIANGVLELKTFLFESFDGLDERKLIDVETARSAGMLLVTSIDQSLLSPELLHQLKASLRSGVERGSLDAKAGFEGIINKFKKAGFQPSARLLIAKMLRAESIANRILLQLDASDC